MHCHPLIFIRRIRHPHRRQVTGAVTARQFLSMVRNALQRIHVAGEDGPGVTPLRNGQKSNPDKNRRSRSNTLIDSSLQ
jgi:hypothetical protein